MSRQQPETRARYRAFEAITTRWMDNDLYNHVNNVVYYSWFDTAVNAYLLRAGVLALRDAPVVYLVVDTGCQYFKPISFPDTVRCGLRVAQLGTSSVRFEIGVFRNDEQEAAAQGHFVHVACDAQTHKPVPLPDGMRAELERLRL
jgi:acyl-CoA thioester hydrolase